MANKVSLNYKKALGKFAFALFYVLMLQGCSHNVSVDKSFVNLFVELRLAEITYGKDSPMARLVRQDALKNAGYNREKFLKQADEILKNENYWIVFQKAVNERIDSLLALPSDNSKTDDNKAKAKKAADAKAERERNLNSKIPSKKGGVN